MMLVVIFPMWAVQFTVAAVAGSIDINNITVFLGENVFLILDKAIKTALRVFVLYQEMAQGIRIYARNN